MEGTVSISFLGEATESEKSMMYRTLLRQKMQAVSITVPVASEGTFSGNDRKHSVHVSTMYGIPLESLPFRGTHTGADCVAWAMAREAEVRSKSRMSLESEPGLSEPLA